MRRFPTSSRLYPLAYPGGVLAGHTLCGVAGPPLGQPACPGRPFGDTSLTDVRLPAPRIMATIKLPRKRFLRSKVCGCLGGLPVASFHVGSGESCRSAAHGPGREVMPGSHPGAQPGGAAPALGAGSPGVPSLASSTGQVGSPGHMSLPGSSWRAFWSLGCLRRFAGNDGAHLERSGEI